MKNCLSVSLFVISLLYGSGVCCANNIAVSNVTLTNQNTAAHYTYIEFDLSWENSWRTSTFESNWDAAWVFIKWRLSSQTTWNHATVNTTGHVAAAGSVITATSDGTGAFIYRDADGIGHVSWSDLRVRWEYGIDGVADTDEVEVYVSAIEMVYVPGGSFYAGDGEGASLRGHFEAGVSGTPYQVTSEAAMTLGGGATGSMGNNNSAGMTTADDFNDATSVTLPASFPKGYKAFYCMKYEITQEQYVAFLNKLNYTQQAARTAVSPASAAGTGALSNSYRNGIDIMTSGINATQAAVYACNLNGNGSYDESDDGQNIPCNFLTWADLAAYLDWSALRPFTELEFEKACRGTLTSVAGEYAWGTASVTRAVGISSSGMLSEVASNTLANCRVNISTGLQGPIRVGSFARAATTRTQAGGSYYGIMELSGNVWERAITVGNATGRSFTGTHGDGILSTTGDGNVSTWPDLTATGAGWRGGNWVTSNSFTRVSDRTYESETDNGRYNETGGRGVRTAP